ncbi:MAG: hypothetical protein V1872_13475 [bacterium]
MEVTTIIVGGTYKYCEDCGRVVKTKVVWIGGTKVLGNGLVGKLRRIRCTICGHEWESIELVRKQLEEKLAINQG